MNRVRVWAVMLLAAMGAVILAGSFVGRFRGVYGYTFALLYVAIFLGLLVVSMDGNWIRKRRRNK